MLYDSRISPAQLEKLYRFSETGPAFADVELVTLSYEQILVAEQGDEMGAWDREGNPRDDVLEAEGPLVKPKPALTPEQHDAFANSASYLNDLIVKAAHSSRHASDHARDLSLGGKVIESAATSALGAWHDGNLDGLRTALTQVRMIAKRFGIDP